MSERGIVAIALTVGELRYLYQLCVKNATVENAPLRAKLKDAIKAESQTG